MRTINVTKSDKTIEQCNIYTYEEYNYNIINTYPKIKSRKGYDIINIPCAFDIETTTIVRGDKKEGFMYIWQFCIDDTVVMGRTWGEYYNFIQKLGNGNNIEDIVGVEVKTLIDTAYIRAQELILEHMDKLHAVAGKLLEKETITAEEFEKIFDN